PPATGRYPFPTATFSFPFHFCRLTMSLNRRSVGRLTSVSTRRGCHAVYAVSGRGAVRDRSGGRRRGAATRRPARRLRPDQRYFARHQQQGPPGRTEGHRRPEREVQGRAREAAEDGREFQGWRVQEL